jgi:hypothetical protein
MPGLVERHLQYVDAIGRLICKRNYPARTHRARIATVASDDCDRAMSGFRQFLGSGA